MGLFKRVVFHPFLFAVYPVLALFAYNIKEVERWVVVRPLAAALILGALALPACRLFFRSWQKAGMAATFLLFLFFTYGHVYQFVRTLPGPGAALGRHRVLGILYLVVLCLGLWWIARRSLELDAATQILNIISTCLVLISLVTIGMDIFRTPPLQAGPVAKVSSASLKVPTGQTLPDVYYIILDGYPREDILESELNFDNNDFINQLKALGFYVAECSHSNYLETELSLSSSLNMDYLSAFGSDFTIGGADRGEMPDLMRHSAARRSLEEIGYKSVAFETGYYWDQWMDADVYLAPQVGKLTLQRFRPFEAMLLKSTAALLVTDAQSVFFKGFLENVNYPYGDHITRELFLLDKMENITSIAGPKLVFAHVLIPHAPLVFAADGSILDANYYSGLNGSAVSPEYQIKGIVQQVQYANSRVLKIVRNILSQSDTAPVIVIQGDHGFRMPTRYAILNAYYLPGKEDSLYPTISPVNTFRVIFDQYFGAQYPLLKDVSYTSDPAHPANFIPVPEISPACLGK
jgi:hypothetical protein